MRQTTSHCLSQCWPRSMSPYGVIRPSTNAVLNLVSPPKNFIKPILIYTNVLFQTMMTTSATRYSSLFDFINARFIGPEIQDSSNVPNKQSDFQTQIFAYVPFLWHTCPVIGWFCNFLHSHNISYDPIGWFCSFAYVSHLHTPLAGIPSVDLLAPSEKDED